MSAAFNHEYSTNDQFSAIRSPEERLAEATAFLTAHFGRMQDGERFVINTFDNERNRKKHPERNIPVQEFSYREFTAAQIEEAARYAINLSETHDVYVSMAITDDSMPKVRKGGRFSKANVSGGYLLWSELDYEAGKEAHMGENLPPSLDDALTILDDLGVEPSEIIHSGHGIHCYWFLDGFLSRDELAKMELALTSAIKGYAQQKGWGVDSTFDVARVLRVPGTKNHKKWPILSIATCLNKTGRHYDVDTLIDAIERAPKPVAKLGMQDFDAKAIIDRKPLDASDEQIIWETSNPAKLRRWLDGDISDHSYDISNTEWAIAKELAKVGANMEQIDRIIGGSLIETERKDKPGKWWEKNHSAEYPHLTYGQLTAMRAIAKVEATDADNDIIVEPDYLDTPEAAEQPVTAPVAAETTSDTPKIIVAPTAAKVIDMAAAAPSIKERETHETDDSNTVTEPISIESKRKEREQEPAKADKYYPLSDEGNARRFEDLFGERLRYVPKLEEWLVYDGTRWAPDEKLEYVKLARTISEEIARDAKKLEDRIKEIEAKADPERADEVDTLKKHAKALNAWAKASQAKARIDAAWNLARTTLSISPNQLDAHPDWLNVKNGTLDLKTGKLLRHNREHYLTKLVNVNYNPYAQAPTWDDFLLKFTQGRVEIIDFLQRAVGYSLLGSVLDEKMFFLYGNGSNGKSTFLKGIKFAIGGSDSGYSHTMSAKALIADASSGNAATPDIAQLKGTRFVTAIETPNGGTLDEATVKNIVSRDEKTARLLHSNPITFDPTHTVWVSTNYKPRVEGRSHGIWRRLLLIGTNARFMDQEEIYELNEDNRGGIILKDPTYEDKLRAEAEGILAWVVKGCQEYLRIGFCVPQDVRAETQTWRSEGADIEWFISEYLTQEPGAKLTPSLMRDMFMEFWNDEHGMHPDKPSLPREQMIDELRRCGIKQVKGNGKWSYRDWRVKTPEEYMEEHGSDEFRVKTCAERLLKWQLKAKE